MRLGVVLTQARVLLRLRGREERDQHEEHTIQHRGSAWNSAVRAAGGEVYRIKVTDQGRSGRAVVVRAWPGHRNIGRDSTKR